MAGLELAGTVSLDHLKFYLRRQSRATIRHLRLFSNQLTISTLTLFVAVPRHRIYSRCLTSSPLRVLLPPSIITPSPLLPLLPHVLTCLAKVTASRLRRLQMHYHQRAQRSTRPSCRLNNNCKLSIQDPINGLTDRMTMSTLPYVRDF